jgi:glycogen phosphorylase
MNDPIRFLHRSEIKGYPSLEEMALDFLWSWNQNHAADKLWEQLDPQLWDLLRNPWIILQTISRETLAKKLAEPAFCQFIETLLQTQRKEAASPTWFQKAHPSPPLNHVAYFSMEYMLDESLPIYSGGLGNVAGDQLKAANDLGVPVVGIGLLYQQGYFHQTIDKDGYQHALYPFNDPGQLPITPLRKANGEWLRLEVALPGWSLWLRAWEVKVGRVRLYLLDTNDAVNLPFHRGIASELYGGDSELRLQQELILGIGGWRLLNALGIQPEVCHLNEGHAAFAILERTKAFMQKTGKPFAEAFACTRAGNLFTTHTAVPAGFDRFSPSLIEQYLGTYAKTQLGITVDELLALGRAEPNNRAEEFNMAYLAIHGSCAVNGVSKLHGKVSRQIFESLFPHWPKNEIPVGHVTNGVHAPSWSSIHAGNLWNASCGNTHWQEATEGAENKIRNATDAQLWQMRNAGRKAMIDFARSRLSRIWAARGFPPEEVEKAKHLFDPNTLTLGFARRFATYKRPNLLLHDPDRLLRILTNAERPVQLILSGKAHPADQPGQALVRDWIQFIRRPEARPHVMFLSDYDILITEYLVQGVDLWINTPRRPWEACGTSGMKVLVNGGLNISELDGWWAEAYKPNVGWALGDGRKEDPERDAQEANELYNLLETQIIPEFYHRDKEGFPATWIKRIRESMATLCCQFSANRSVREYTERYYLPAAKNYSERSTNNGALGKKILDWQRALQNHWHSLRFGDIKINTQEKQHHFEVQIYFDDLDPQFTKIELYAEGANDRPPFVQAMECVRELSGTARMYVFRAAVSAERPASDYTPRIIPCCPGATVPLEAAQILWYH